MNIVEEVYTRLLEKIASRKTKTGDKFNLNYFKSISIGEDGDISGTLEGTLIPYADKFLTISGEGSSRVVFILSGRFALKIAKKNSGIAQNKAEREAYEKISSKELVAKVYQHDKFDRWLISDLVKPLRTEEEFEQLTGDTFESLEEFLTLVYGKATYPDDASDFFESVVSLVDEADLEWGDLTVIDQWGKTTDGRAVVLDYGLTPDVYDEYYKGLSGAQTHNPARMGAHDEQERANLEWWASLD